MPKRKTTTKRRSKTSSPKKKLIGYTRVKKKYKLVFQKGRKKMLGRSTYSSRKSLLAAAKRKL